MSQKLKTVIGILILALLLAAAYVAYQSLAGDQKDSLKFKNNQAQTQEGSRPSNQEGSGPQGQEGRGPQGQEGSEPQNRQQETLAPDFTVYDEKGQPVKLSDFRGQPVVINFWATWCPPCREELPDFDQAYRTYKDDVVFMMVDLTNGIRETQDKAEKYIRDHGFEFPVYFDKKQQAAKTYGIQSIPLTVFIDREGNIAGGQVGMLDKDALNKGIDLILNE